MLGDGSAAGVVLTIPARTILRVPIVLHIPQHLTRAPSYLVEESKAIRESGLLLERTHVTSADLHEFTLVFVNPSETAILLPQGAVVADANRIFDPGRDGMPPPHIRKQNMQFRRAADAALAKQTKKLAAQVQTRLDAVAEVARTTHIVNGKPYRRIPKSPGDKTRTVRPAVVELNAIAESKDEDPREQAPDQAATEGHYNKLYGWRGLRYDPNDEDQVASLLEKLAVDAMSFPDATTTQQTQAMQERVRKLMCDYSDVFAADDSCPGASDLEPLRLELADTRSRPVRAAPYRTTPMFRDFIADQVAKLLKSGAIRPSYSPWASPVSVVRHPTGKLRMVCDFRRVNHVTKVDAHPLPDIEAILQQLGKMKYFSCVDLCAGFHQVPLEDDTIPMTAITTHVGIFEWLVTPFGIASAPSHFTRCVSALLAGMTYRNAMSFIDDILIYSETFEDHMRDLREFFERLRKFKVSLKPSKCEFFARTASYLGYTLSTNGIEPIKQKVQAITGIKPPQSLTQLRSFIQMVNFYRRFIPNMSALAKPFTDLTRKENGIFKGWTPGSPEDLSFDQLKLKLTEAPLLRHARDDLPFIIEVDASKEGYASVLCQDFPIEDVTDLPGHDQVRAPHVRLPVHFASRKTKGGEPKRAPTHLEAGAVIWALDYYKHFHHGRSCTVYTDHGPLTWLMSTTNKDNSLLARYALRLQAYAPHVKIEYKPGRINSVPDTLSRLPVDLDNDTKNLDDIIIPAEYYISAVAAYHADAEQAEHAHAQRRAHHAHDAHAYRASILPDDHDPDALDLINGDAWDVAYQGLVSDTPFHLALQEQQDRCPAIADLRDYLLDNARGRRLPSQDQARFEAQRVDWTVQGGLLRRLVRVKEKKDKVGNVVQEAQVLFPVVLPADTPLKAKIFETLHDHPHAAHIGERKFAEAIRSRFYWQGWYNDAQAHVKTCDGCQRYKALRRLKPGCVLPIHAPTPFHTIGIDLIGPLPPSRGMTWALVIICHFTRWPIVVALASKEPKRVAKALYERVVRDYDVPVRILSDRGGEFVNEVMAHFCELLNIEHVKTAPYHPATNGKTERFNRFLKKAVAIVVATYGKSWVLYLDPICFAYRRAPIAAMGRTPHMALFLTPGRLPIDLLTAAPEDLQLSDERFFAQRLTRMARMWQQMRDMQSDNAAGWDEVIGEATRLRIYNEGDNALVYMPPNVKGSRAFSTY